MFAKATKKRAKIRLAIDGPSGGGKTFTSLLLACKLGKRVAVVDTEHGSASLYADKFQFDVMELTDYHPDNYIKAIRAAEEAGYDVIVLDSITHAWSGAGGVLQIVDDATAQSRTGNAFGSGWKKATPIHQRFIDAMLSCKMHLIATMRTKQEYVIEEDARTHKKVPRKLGMAPVQRDGMEYEFTVVADMDLEHTFVASKTRCSALDGKVFKVGETEKVADLLLAWLNDGAEESPSRPATPAPVAQASSDARAQMAAQFERELDKPQPDATDALLDDVEKSLNGRRESAPPAASPAAVRGKAIRDLCAKVAAKQGVDAKAVYETLRDVTGGKGSMELPADVAKDVIARLKAKVKEAA